MLRELLLRTLQAIEFHNLSEILPIEALSWYDQHKIEQEALDRYEKTEVQKFIEGYIQGGS